MRVVIQDQPESIAVGVNLTQASIPLFVAEDQKLFTRNGLNASLKYYDTALKGVDGLLNSEVDIACPVSEYVLARAGLNNQKFQTIGCFDKVDYVVILGRKDRGIESVADLKGKKIGVIRGLVQEFYLGRF